MLSSSFDPTRAVRFDLSQGSVKAGRDAEPVLLVPCAALEALVRSASAEAVEALGRAMGAAIGRGVVAALQDPKSATMEVFLTHFAGEGALAGVGLLSIERWGRALVVVIERSPLPGALLAPLVAAAMETTFGRKVHCTLLSRDERAARVLVASERAIDRVRAALATGTPWAQALGMLHGGKA
jgi:hypothetical protein